MYLCILLSDLTSRYGPVIREAKVVSVLDAAFDVLVPEFGIEKRVHVDQMPIDVSLKPASKIWGRTHVLQNHVYDEHTYTLQIYWSDRDVISWLAENSDDEHLKKVKQTAEQHAVKMEVASRSVHDEKALFDEDDGDDDEIVLGRDSNVDDDGAETSEQRLLSKSKAIPPFEGLKTTASGHKIQEIKELMTVPVCNLKFHQMSAPLTCLLCSGHCHCRSYEEPPSHQGVQRQSLCQRQALNCTDVS